MALYRIDPEEVLERARRVTHLFLDCDGVLTDGRIPILPDGGEVKVFDVRDGQGIVLWRRAGHKAGIISGRGSRGLEVRAGQLGVDYLVQNSPDKLESFARLTAEAGLAHDEVAYMGDDVIDIPLMLQAGLAVAPPEAVDEVIATAHVVTAKGGGRGAVRELVELLLKAQGRWEALVGQYRA